MADDDPMNLAMAMYRQKFSPTWGAQPNQAGQDQTSNVGMPNMLTNLAKGLMRPTSAPSTAASIGSISPADTSSLYGLSGISASNLAPAAASTGTSGLLPGSVAGANMADTAAYTPSMIEASSPGAGAGATAAGLGAGLGAFGAWYGASRALAGSGELNAKDMNRNLAGDIATGQQKVAQLQAQGNAAAAAQLQTQIDGLYVQDAQYRKSLGLPPLVNPNASKDAHGLTWNDQYIADHSGSGGRNKIL